MPPKSARGPGRPATRQRTSTAKSTATGGSGSKAEAKPKSRKRKAAEEPEPEPPKPRKTQKKSAGAAASTTKKTKQAEISASSADKLESPIVINRAPVLQLWGACVAHLVHPELSWPACLSVGSSIATITAISKGRSIGTVAPKDPDSSEKGKKKKRKDPDVTELKVMGFPMAIKGDAVIVKGKPQPGKEDALVRKYQGEENLARVRETMEQALETWRGEEEELDGQAFHMYEKFRPQVPAGQKGWGRKAELHLSKIENAVRK